MDLSKLFPKGSKIAVSKPFRINNNAGNEVFTLKKAWKKYL
jgi:hypothetical protein